MKQANKFMVVPYEEQKLIKSVEQTPDSKITDIVNNKNLDKNDKVKLINQLLVKKQKNWPTSDEFPDNVDDENFDQTFNDGFENNDQVSFEKSFNNNAVNSKNSKSTIKKKQKKTTLTKAFKNKTQNLSRLNSYINDLNQTLNNAQLFLPPTASTRNQIKQIKNPISFSNEAIQKSLADFISKPSSATIINKDLISKSTPVKIFKRKKRKNPYNITDLKNLEVKKLKKTTNSEPIQQESIQIDQTGEGFWSFYKK
jgi:hypothetical protein